MANIIKQLKDSDGNNIYPIAYAQGGVKMDLLWTNPNPSSSFSAQTISVDLSEYSLVLLLMNGDDTTQKFYIFAPLGETTNYQYQSEASTGVWFHFRSITTTTSGVTFGDAVDHAYNSWGRSTNNLRAIPYQIYGIKMSYIVPTVVQGLQYVEV